MDTARHQQLELQRFLSDGGSGYGQQWGTPSDLHLRPVVDFIQYAASRRPDQHWLEIGCGGGRWSRVILQHSGIRLHLVDGCTEAEILTRRHCGDLAAGIDSFHVCPDGVLLPTTPHMDVVFSFDTFVHFPPDLFHNYLTSIAQVLRPGGLLYLHHAGRFPEDPCWSDGSGCFVYYTPASIQAWCAQLGLTVADDLSGLPLEFPSGHGSLVQGFRRDA